MAGNNMIDLHPQHDLRIHDIGKDIYAYMTPVIIVIGLVGNGISLKVFTSKVSLWVGFVGIIIWVWLCYDIYALLIVSVEEQ